MLITRIHGPKYNWIVCIDLSKNIQDEIREIMALKNKLGSQSLLIGKDKQTTLYMI